MTALGTPRAAEPEPRAVRRAVEPVVVGFVVGASVGVGVVHAVALVVAALLSQARPTEAARTTAAMVSVAFVLAVVAMLDADPRRRRSLGIALAVLAGGVVALLDRSLSAAAIAVALVGIVQAVAGSAFADRLRGALGGIALERPLWSALWGILGLLLVAQSARLSTYMADPSAGWWLTTRDPFWSQHMCLPAYLHAADLHRQGEPNVYDARHYAALTPGVEMRFTVENMAPFAGDAFQYPPQFLLLPELALRVTNDFLAVRTIWYALQLAAFVVVAVALAAWIGGSAGRLAALLVPLVWLSVPVMQSLQFGQFHLAAVVMSVAAMLLFERGRSAAGGALLAGATAGKLFPGALVLFLIAGRRWRQLGWVVLFLCLYSLAALLVFGPAPFQAFLSYQVPHLASGEAFDFAKAFPEERETLIALNFSPASIVGKLRELGIPGATPAAGKAVSMSFLVLCVGLCLAAGLRTPPRADRACAWLAILTLASLLSAAAWGDYVTAGSVWLVTLLVAPLRSDRLRWAVMLVFGAFFFLVPGAVPMPYRWPVPLAMVLTTMGVSMVVGLNAWVLVRAARGRWLS